MVEVAVTQTRTNRSRNGRGATRIPDSEVPKIRALARSAPKVGTQAVPWQFRVDAAKLPKLPGYASTGLRDDVTRMLTVASRIMNDTQGGSPAAAVGLAGILSSYQHPYRTFAITEMVEFLQHAQWTPQLQALVTQAVRQETKYYRQMQEEGEPYQDEGLLKLQLREQELRVVSFFLGRGNVSKAGQVSANIATQLSRITDSERARSVAHIMAATGFRFGSADGATPLWTATPWEELYEAAPLIATVYDAKDMPGIIERISTGS